jgi:hypothetical protein
MFFRNSKLGNLTLTLVIYVALFLALSICSDAKGLHLEHRDHANLKRLIKKRSSSFLVPVIGAGADVPVFPSTTSVSSPASSTTQSTISGTTSSSDTSISSSVSHYLFLMQLKCLTYL